MIISLLSGLKLKIGADCPAPTASRIHPNLHHLQLLHFH